jgi:hypothetical protein
MRHVTDWLEKFGMSEYAERFVENDIEFTLLPELTDEDLENIGVASLGHRCTNPQSDSGARTHVGGGDAGRTRIGSFRATAKTRPCHGAAVEDHHHAVAAYRILADTAK